MRLENPYEVAGRTLLRESGCTVRQWRTSMSGKAYADNSWSIAAPRPRGPISFYVFAHEVAHQLLHRGNSKPRWLEEIEADEWALAQFERFNLDGQLRARARAADYLCYSFWKAAKRCSAETAQAILDRSPGWAWDGKWWRAAETLERLCSLANGVVVP